MTASYHPHTSTAEASGGLRLMLLNTVLRQVIKRRLQTLPITVESAQERREEINAVVGRFMSGRYADLEFKADLIAHVPVERVIPSNPGDHVVLYIHGGAFVLCSPLTHRGITAPLSKQLSSEVVAVDYRLAPEHPYPAAVNDVLDVYRALLDTVGARGLTVAGDSAGGNLVLALLHAAKAEGLDMPASAVCLSPWTDLTGASDSIRENIGSDVLLPGERMHELALMYLDGAYVREPTASPVYGDFEGFPPLLFHVGDREILLDDTLRVVDRARQAGAEAHLRIWPGVPHVFHAFSSHLPVAREALHEIGEFMAMHFRQPR